MTEFQHALVGGIILMIIWFRFASKFFKSKDEKQWEDFFKRYW